MRAMIRKMREHAVAHSVDVGETFPAEARRIHFGEVEPRAIRGKASPEEARALAEDGVEFLPLPVLPEERN